MSLLLNIDTAVDKAIISIAKDGEILQEAINNQQKDHGAFLQPAIQSILKKAGIHLSELDVQTAHQRRVAGSAAILAMSAAWSVP